MSANASLAMCPLDVIVASTKSVLAANKAVIFVETLNSVLFNVNNVCKNQLVSMRFKFFDGKDSLVVLFKTKR